jgi:MinD-like ATPase involved in chromosome partitioning or flagellar assembly
VGTVPVVTAVRAADVGRRVVAVVASEAVAGVVAAIMPSAEVRRYPNIRELWTGAVAGGHGELPALVVLAGEVAEAADELATAIAFLAPRAAVVLLHRPEELESLGAVYLRVVAAHPGEANPDAWVEVVATPTTGARLTDALRTTAPAELTVEECPPPLAGPLDTPSSPTKPPEPRRGGAGHEPVAPVTIAVASAKGGAGKSTTALALAATFARTQPGSRVCVVDLDVRDGQLATLLDHVGPTVADLCADPAGITDATVQGYLVHDDRLGVWALLAPPAGSDAATELLAGAAYRDILATLRRRFEVVIVDCPVTYREPLIADVAFAAADYIVAVTTLAVTSLAGVERMLRWLTEGTSTGGLGVARHKLGAVVNGALNGVVVDRAQVAAHTAGVPVVAVVPHAARDILLATNRHRFDLLAGHPDLGPAYLQLAAWCASPLPQRPLVTSAVA